MRKITIAIVLGIILPLTGGYLYFNNQNSPQNYLPKEQRKNVEAYFTENMRVSPSEAKEMASKGVDLRVSKDTTLTGIVGNLYYYGFIDNEKAFTKLLETSIDTTSGRQGAIKIGNNSIDTNSSYYLNYQMTEKEIAETLLNKGRYSDKFNDYTYLFMPSGPEGSSRRPGR